MIQEEQTVNLYNYKYTNISFLELWANIMEVIKLIGGDDIEIIDFINKLKNKNTLLDNYENLFEKLINQNIFRPDFLTFL